MVKKPFKAHLDSPESLVTTYEQTRAGFIAMALEKNRAATPYVEQAKVLKTHASKAQRPTDLLGMVKIRAAVLTASGISDKAVNHLRREDQDAAIKELIDKFLEPAGKDFVDELVYRFLLTRGDTIGGEMRNLAGALAERKLIRTLIAMFAVSGRQFSFLKDNQDNWQAGSCSDPEIELSLRGLFWSNTFGDRTLLLNRSVPFLKKNVDLCLFSTAIPGNLSSKSAKDILDNPSGYLALGELKGGIDPAGADEHWKTANTALDRIAKAFKKRGHAPLKFFIAAAIERAMAEEIYSQLSNGKLANAANLTIDSQLSSLCSWLVSI